ncbi:histone-lysine N-methyltransferase, H3 lysine-9 specific SUVH5-like [Primulina eburnea]|uniref:histone-lysine N-methyltransferase, H3 lysine-9 specific SUVH5-like n=1 Tax=Primulina eburnea TaxID=1245227 RepID=UPI003C6C470F
MMILFLKRTEEIVAKIGRSLSFWIRISMKLKRNKKMNPWKTLQQMKILPMSSLRIHVMVSLKNCITHQELGNLCIVKRDGPEGCKVREALMKFEEHYEALKKEQKQRKAEMGEGQKCKSYAHIEAAERVKAEGMCISVQNPFGHIPGIEIGDTFRFRAQLVVVGLHRQMVSGIGYVTIGGEKFATCVVDSGRYENEAKTNDSLIYSGQGGNPKFVEKAADQKLTRGNLAMANSMDMGYPVRVIRKRKSGMRSYGFANSNDSKYLFVYDGLYAVTKYWQERDQNGSLVFKFELIRMPDQPRPRQTVAKPGKLLPRKEICVTNDVSQGLETLKIRAMNGIDDLRPPPFSYINNIIYPNWYRRVEPIGCNCLNGCSDSRQCSCVVRNGGEIPFNEKGSIVRSRTIVYECGPNCKCPPSCMNRVSQRPPRIQLEIFKTKERGWGVRTRDYVTSGSFICEYIGELLRDKEAEQRIGHDEYLFDIGDGYDEDGESKGLDGSRNIDAFAIDACKFGNVSRFINHSCSPNMYAQDVLYDHHDKKMPHVMFFATRNIPALRELTYNYNYMIDRVCDANGDIKKKHCFCGSRNCNGRMY